MKMKPKLKKNGVEMKLKNETGMNMKIKSHNAARAQVVCEVQSLIVLPVTNIIP